MTDNRFIPPKVDQYIKEFINDGSDVILTSSEDDNIAIIKVAGLGDWYTILSWHNDIDSYQIVNITGKAYKILGKLLTAGD